MKKIRRLIRFHGYVQGVGFRWRAMQAANAAGATGWVRNEEDGSVLMEIQGTEEQIDSVVQTIRKSIYIDIRNIKAVTIPVIENERSFEVKASWWF